MTPEELAKLFHDTYERLAPAFGYKTRRASAVPWIEVPEKNRSLMIAVSSTVLNEIKRQYVVRDNSLPKLKDIKVYGPILDGQTKGCIEFDTESSHLPAVETDRRDGQ